MGSAFGAKTRSDHRRHAVTIGQRQKAIPIDPAAGKSQYRRRVRARPGYRAASQQQLALGVRRRWNRIIHFASRAACYRRGSCRSGARYPTSVLIANTMDRLIHDCLKTTVFCPQSGDVVRTRRIRSFLSRGDRIFANGRAISAGYFAVGLVREGFGIRVCAPNGSAL